MKLIDIDFACDADMCARGNWAQGLRETITLEEATEIHKKYKTSHEGEVKERNNRKHSGAATPSKL